MIEDQLDMLSRSNYYPFHMPGHKRNTGNFSFPEFYHRDITEIRGFDNLHHPEGILKDAQERAAALWGAKNSFFLVNGSTVGILAAVSAAFAKGSKIICAQNCHKAVYHSIVLRELSPIFVNPDIIEEGFLQGAVKTETIENYYIEHPDAKGVIITSPTYDGIVSDVQAISKIVHDHKGILIVDEAHGAHFGLHEGFPESAVKLGADLVIQSLHKTLPAPTQTAILHRCSDRIEKQELQKFLNIYETSSPSYILLAAIEQCILYLETHGKERFHRFLAMLQQFEEKCQNLNNLTLNNKKAAIQNGACSMDQGKLLIMTYGSMPRRNRISGNTLSELLYKDYELEMEMSSLGYVLGIATIMDTEEGFTRLADALIDIDKKLNSTSNKCRDYMIFQEAVKRYFSFQRTQRGSPACSMSVAFESSMRKIPINKCVGKVSGEFFYLYPPGIPIVVPGQYFTKEAVDLLCFYHQNGFFIQGNNDYSLEYVKILA